MIAAHQITRFVDEVADRFQPERIVLRNPFMAIFFAGLLCVPVAPARGDQAAVTAARTPDGGLQPEVAVDEKNAVHLVYLKGDPAASDVYYVCSVDGGTTWSEPVRVNSERGSALALGTVRGAHLAIGTHGSLHVAWAGSKNAQPKAPGDKPPMLYARGSIGPSGKVSFEPQRNVASAGMGLDGGSVAADEHGHVYVAWHAPAHKGGREDDRRVWVAVSADDGTTFAPEVAISDESLGICSCCGLDVLAGRDGKLYAIYRAESDQVNRDIYLASADVSAARPHSTKLAATRSGICLMSTPSLTRGPRGIVGAWETKDQVQWGVMDPVSGGITDPATVAGSGCKHPAIAVDSQGNVLVAWALGTGWNKGGSVGWQAYDAQGRPIRGESGHADGLPVWSKPAAFARPGGGFVVLY